MVVLSATQTLLLRSINRVGSALFNNVGDDSLGVITTGSGFTL